MAVFYLATLLKGRGIGEEEGDQEERQGSGEGGRSIVVQYLSNDITVCSSFILANETMISFYFSLCESYLVKLLLSINIYHYINSM